MRTHPRPLLGGFFVLCAALSATGCAEQEPETDTSTPVDIDADTELPDTDTGLPDTDTGLYDTDTTAPDTDTSAPELTPSIFTAGVCLEGWCFEQPLPFGPRVLWPRAFWAASSDEAWAVVGSTLVHWKDQRWTVAGGEDGTAHPTTRFAAQLDGTGPDNVVVGTSDGAMRFDGSTWAPMVDCPEPAAVWVAGPDDVWLAAAERGPDDVGRVTVHRWTGDGCEVVQTFEGAESPLLDGASTGDGWMALRIRPNPPPSDVSGRLLRWDGSTWEAVIDLGTVRELVSVTPDLAWAGAGSKLWRWDGASWSETTEEHFSAFWFASETEGWGTMGHGAGAARTGSLMHWDGAAWTTVATEPDYLLHLYGAGPDDVLATQEGGFGARWDGESWTPTLPTPEPLDLVDVAVGPTGEVWAVAENGLMRGVGGVWSLVDPEGGSVVWSGAEGEAWVGGASGLRRWADGGSAVDLPSGVDGEVVAIWGTSPELVFVATPDTLNHWTGEGWAWSRAAPRELGALKAIHGSGPDDVWVVGTSGLAKITGEGWELADLPTCYGGTNGPIEGELVDLWVDTPGHPVVVNEGSYLDWDAIVDTMTLLQPGEEGWTCGVYRNGLRDIRIAGCDGQMRVAAAGELGATDDWHWDSTWIGGKPTAITCAPGRGFWVVGQGGMIAHRPPAAR